MRWYSGGFSKRPREVMRAHVSNASDLGEGQVFGQIVLDVVGNVAQRIPRHKGVALMRDGNVGRISPEQTRRERNGESITVNSSRRTTSIKFRFQGKCDVFDLRVAYAQMSH